MNTPARISVQILTAIVGGYAFTSGYVAVLSIVLARLGMARGEAVVLSGMTGFIIYLFIIVCVFTSPKLWQSSAIVSASSIAMIILSPYLTGCLWVFEWKLVLLFVNQSAHSILGRVYRSARYFLLFSGWVHLVSLMLKLINGWSQNSALTLPKKAYHLTRHYQ